MRTLTKKEEIIMEHFWSHGELFMRELKALYPEDGPSFNTLSSQVRTLENDGFIGHISYGPIFRYFPAVSREEYCRSSLSALVDKWFDRSYPRAVSALVKDEMISVEELKHIIEQIEHGA